jgi:hypothetical protein
MRPGWLRLPVVFFFLGATPDHVAAQQVVPDSTAANYVGQTITVEGRSSASTPPARATRSSTSARRIRIRPSRP